MDSHGSLYILDGDKLIKTDHKPNGYRICFDAPDKELHHNANIAITSNKEIGIGDVLAINCYDPIRQDFYLTDAHGIVVR